MCSCGCRIPPSARSSRRLGRAEARAAHAGLDVAYDVPVQLDLDLVLLDVPVGDGGQPAERPPPPGHELPAAVDQRPPLGGGQPRLLLEVAAADAEHLV